MFLVGFTFNEDGEAARFRMIDDDAAKGTKEIEQPKEGGREFISSVVLRVVTRERIDKVQGWAKERALGCVNLLPRGQREPGGRIHAT